MIPLQGVTIRGLAVDGNSIYTACGGGGGGSNTPDRRHAMTRHVSRFHVPIGLAFESCNSEALLCTIAPDPRLRVVCHSLRMRTCTSHRFFRGVLQITKNPQRIFHLCDQRYSARSRHHFQPPAPTVLFCLRKCHPRAIQEL